MIRPVPALPALVLIVLYFLGLYCLIRLSPCLGLNWTDYWEPTTTLLLYLFPPCHESPLVARKPDTILSVCYLLTK